MRSTVLGSCLHVVNDKGLVVIANQINVSRNWELVDFVERRVAKWPAAPFKRLVDAAGQDASRIVGALRAVVGKADFGARVPRSQ